MIRPATLPTLAIKDLEQFLVEHAIDLRSFNFFDKKALQSLNWSSETLSSLRALQRLMRLLPLSRVQHQAGSSSEAQQAIALHLLDRGLTSARQITAISASKFIATYADCFPSTSRSKPASQARNLYKKALAIKSKAVLNYVAIVQQTEAHYRKLRSNNLTQATGEEYGDLPSYEELFGGLDFCTCKDCRSIFSPAAYLVDLMRLVADQIVQEGEDLLARRPDLPNLVLSCENTNHLVSKLEIVNGLLLNHVPGGSSEAEKYKALVTTTYPFNLPFHLPLEKIRTYLAGHQTSLATLWKELTLPSSDQAKCQEAIL